MDKNSQSKAANLVNLVIIDSTPYRLNGYVPMRLAYRAMLNISLDTSTNVANKDKDSFGDVNRLVPSDFVFLHALENNKVPTLTKLQDYVTTERGITDVVAWGTNHTLIVSTSKVSRRELRKLQADQFGPPVNAKVIQMRAVDEAVEDELDAAEAKIVELEQQLANLHKERTDLQNKLRNARRDTSQAERLADHVELLPFDVDFEAHRRAVKATFVTKAETENWNVVDGT